MKEEFNRKDVTYQWKIFAIAAYFRSNFWKYQHVSDAFSETQQQTGRIS
jgi:hypothetical protein